MRPGAIALSVSTLLALAASSGARADSQAFIQQCVANLMPTQALYPRTVNWRSACSCAGERLRAQGYDPDLFWSEINAGMATVVRQPTGPQAQAIRQAFIKREMDESSALNNCIQADKAGNNKVGQ
jgi:hypothetical protein